MFKTHTLWVAIAAQVIGCVAAAEEPGDVTRRSDAPFADGTPEALGVITVANEISFELLNDSTKRGGVGLDVRAAENIVRYRSGADQIDGTHDDIAFTSVSELDAVRWVGPSSFALLLDYALVGGYIDSAIARYVYGVRENSREATALLEVANYHSQHELDNLIGLDSRSARNIADYRSGPDGVLHSTDDRRIDSLVDLDRIRFVGRTSFARLLDFAVTHGYMP